MPATCVRPTRLLAVLLTALGLLICAGAREASAAEVGVVPDITWGVSKGEVDRTVAEMKDLGVRWVRTGVSWKSLEPNARGGFSAGYLNEIDYAINAAQSAGLRVLMPLADSVPYWASADPKKYSDGSGNHWNSRYRPTRMSDYADAMGYLVRHYAARGVHVYEVWNEPNLASFWPSGPDAAEYVSMLKPAYAAIKAEDPSATVLLGGLAHNSKNYLDRIYQAGGGPYFDVVSDHVYPSGDPSACWNGNDGRPSADALCGIEEVRRVMVANGDAEKRVWVTEFGWSTCDNAYSSCYGKGVSEAKQAEYLKAGMQKLDSYPWVSVALWYCMRNVYFFNEKPGDWNSHLGLERIDHTKKPAYSAFRDWANSQSTTTTVGTIKKNRKGSRAKVAGRVSSPNTGTVLIVVQRRHGGRWVRHHAARRQLDSNRRFAAWLRLGTRPGKARVRVHYMGSAGFRRSSSPYRRL